MKIIPSIDLFDGKCVRLKQGDFSTMQVYPNSPVALAKHYAQQEASWLHVVDLQRANNQSCCQIEIIAQIACIQGLSIQVGGGIRSREDMDKLFTLGVDRVVIGSMAVEEKDTVQEWLHAYGAEKIVLALDFRMCQSKAYIHTKAWKKATTLEVTDVLAWYSKLKYVLCTNIEKDGEAGGVCTDFYKRLKLLFPDVVCQVSGGVGCLQHILDVRDSQLEQVIVGRSLIEGNVDLQEAMACLK